MDQDKDGEVEARAMQLAQGDHLEWVKRPHRPDEADTPEAATNAERETYRRQARAEMEQHERPACEP